MSKKGYDVVWRQSEHGRSSVGISCPFCNGMTTAYVWSLSANGKRCDNGKCDAIFYRSGLAELAPRKKAKKGGAA